MRTASKGSNVTDVDGYALTGDAQISAQLSEVAYMDDSIRPKYLNLGYTGASNAIVLHTYNGAYSDQDIAVYQPVADAPDSVPVWIAYKGTSDTYNLLKDLHLMQYPESQVFFDLLNKAYSFTRDYMNAQPQGRNVKMCGHSLGALQAHYTFHHLLQGTETNQASMLHRLDGVVCINPFIQATAFVKEIYDICQSTNNPLATVYNTKLVSHIIDSDISSLLLRDTNTSYGQVFVHPNKVDPLFSTLESISYFQYIHEWANHTYETWDYNPLHNITFEEMVEFLPERRYSFESYSQLYFHKFANAGSAPINISGAQGKDNNTVYANQPMLYHSDMNDYAWKVVRNYPLFTHANLTLSWTYTAYSQLYPNYSFEFRMAPNTSDIAGGENYYITVPKALPGSTNTAHGYLAAPTVAQAAATEPGHLPIELSASHVTPTSVNIIPRYLWAITPAVGFSHRRVITEVHHMGVWDETGDHVFIQMHPKYNGNNLASESADGPWYNSLIEYSDGSQMASLLAKNEVNGLSTQTNSELPASGDHKDSTIPDETILKVEWDSGAGSTSTGHYTITWTELAHGVLIKLTDLLYPNVDYAVSSDRWNNRPSLMDEVHLELVDYATSEFYVYSYAQSDLSRSTPYYFRSVNEWNSTLCVTTTKLNSQWFLKKLASTIVTGTL